MGILKNLTDEYFGKKIRTEDRIISTYLKKCIDSNKRDLFIKVNKGWGEDGKTILLYEKDVTLIGEAKIMTPEEAIRFYEYELNSKFRCLHIDNFITTAEEYKRMTDASSLPENIQASLDKLFQLYYEYPEVTSYFTHMEYNPLFDLKTNIYPGEISIFNGDESFEGYDEYEEGDDVVEFITTDGLFFKYNDGDYNSKIKAILDEICDEFKKKGFKVSYDMLSCHSAEGRYFFGKIK
jgi:hypothetical protein